MKTITRALGATLALALMVTATACGTTGATSPDARRWMTSPVDQRAAAGTAERLSLHAEELLHALGEARRVVIVARVGEALTLEA